MNKKSIFYKHPLLYIWGLKWIHKTNFAKRYRYMASFVKKGDLVLEPACGPATLADFLPKEADYHGFDTNKDFTDYALKKHPGVYLGNVLDFKSYCQADVVIACDILHHLKPADRKRFIKNCFSSTKKIFIICEPHHKKSDKHSLFYSLKKRLVEWIELDGTNNVKMSYFFTRDQLLNQIKSGFGVIPSSVKRGTKEFGEDIVAIFFKNGRLSNKGWKRKSVSAIVPVFNEEKTVAGVINVLLKNPLIDEIICINDGSTDKSLSILKKFKHKIKLIDLKKNQGKGFALVAGIKKAKGEIITFIDADLVNFSDGHIKTLLNPILENKARVVLGYFVKGWFLPGMFSQLTGERAYYKKDLVPCFEKMAKTRFGVEVFLNNVFNEKETKKIHLKQLRDLYKYEKHDSLSAFKEYLGEAVEIAQEIGRREGLLPADKQIIAGLARVASFKELKKKVGKIRNKQIKQLLEKYVLRYIRPQRFKNQKVGYKKKLLPIGIILGVLTLIVVSRMFFYEKGHIAPKEFAKRQVSLEDSEGENEYIFNSLEEVLNKGVAMKCTWEIDNQYFGEGYIKNKMFYSKHKREGKTTFVIIKDNCLWSWKEGEGGFKICAREEDNLYGFTTLGIGSVQDVSQKYRCISSEVADSVFEIPENVAF